MSVCFSVRFMFFDPPYEWPGLELGWTLSRPIWGQGYATQAAELALDWGFQTLQTDEILSAINPSNAASIRVAERLGLTYVRDDQLQGMPCRIYTLTREAWRARRASRS